MARTEVVLSGICNGQAILYSSGLSAAYAALVHYQPKRVLIRNGYHGCHNTIKLYARTRGITEFMVDLDVEDIGPGDLVWLETPLNPYGEARDIEAYARKAHDAGATLLVDATFAPPPLLDPFKWGADMVLHSGSKYFGGHTDILCGVLVVPDEKSWRSLWYDRSHLGSVLGSMETWLLLRSLRTLSIRVKQQAATATAFAKWLNGSEFKSLIKSVYHATAIQVLEPGQEFIKQQLADGPPCFGFATVDPLVAKYLPHHLDYFVPATSLGGVESLIEQRQVTDPSCDPCMIRISIGLEDLADLQSDFKKGLQIALAKAQEDRESLKESLNAAKRQKF